MCYSKALFDKAALEMNMGFNVQTMPEPRA